MADYEVQRLSQLCLPRWYDRIRLTGVKPERPEFFELLTGQKPNPNWTSALERLLLAINNTQCQRPCLLKQPDKSKKQCDICMAPTGCAARFSPKHQPRTKLEKFIQGLDGFEYPEDIPKPVLGAVALILYDQECSGRVPHTDPKRVTTLPDLPPPPTRTREQRDLEAAFDDLTEHMLLVDYGVEEDSSRARSLKHFKYRLPDQGLIPAALNPIAAYLTQFVGRIRDSDQNPDQLPSVDEWRALVARIITICWASVMAAETALMLYQYHTHRHCRVLDKHGASDEADRDEPGLTGYTGNLQEMIDHAEVNNRRGFNGRDRLLRKLSMDLLLFTSRTKGSQKVLRKAIQEIADEFFPVEGGRRCLYAPAARFDIPIPEFDKTHRDGYTKEDKKLLLRKFGFFTSDGGAYFDDERGLYNSGVPMSRKQRGVYCFDPELCRSRSVSSSNSILWELKDEENARQLPLEKNKAVRREAEREAAAEAAVADHVPDRGNTVDGSGAGCNRAGGCCKVNGCERADPGHGPGAPNWNASRGIRILPQDSVNAAGFSEGWIDKPRNGPES